MTEETKPETSAPAQPAKVDKEPDPNELIKVRWDGPDRVFPDWVRAIRRNEPKRIPAVVRRGDILEITRRDRGPFHADTTSKADPINVIKEQ